MKGQSGEWEAGNRSLESNSGKPLPRPDSDENLVLGDC